MAEMIFHPEARAELRAAAAYYESCRTGLGREFLTQVENAAALVLLNPHAGGVIRAPYQRLIIRRFPMVSSTDIRATSFMLSPLCISGVVPVTGYAEPNRHEHAVSAGSS